MPYAVITVLYCTSTILLLHYSKLCSSFWSVWKKIAMTDAQRSLLYYTMLYYAILCYAILYFLICEEEDSDSRCKAATTILSYIMLSYITLNQLILCYTMLYSILCAVLHCPLPDYALLYDISKAEQQQELALINFLTQTEFILWFCFLLFRLECSRWVIPHTQSTSMKELKL